MASHAELSAERLFAPTLPEAWRPLCSLLRELEALAVSDRPRPARMAEAKALRERLLAAARAVPESPPPALRADAPRFSRLFAEAVLLWTWFAAAGGEVLVDTHGSETIAHFPVDLPSEAAPVVRAALATLDGVDADALADMHRAVARLTANLPVKNAVARALADAHGADPRGLFSALYGPLPLRPGDVQVVVTTTMVFVCLPIDGEALAQHDWAARPEPERAAIAAWLRRVDQAAMQTRFVRFPAFGLFEPEAVDAGLMARVARAVRATPALEAVDDAVVAQTLETMVVIVPSADAEKFFVHDVWGHGWQETLLDFEWLMDDLERVATPLSPRTGTELADATALVEAFRGPELDERAALASIEASLRARIVRGVNVVVSENLADLLEHKFVRQVGERELPSSSLTPGATLKLDLSLQDVQRMVRLWRRPFRKLAADAEAREHFAAALVAAGAAPAGIAARVGRLLALVDEAFGAAMHLELPDPGRTGPVSTSVAGRVMAGTAALDAALTDFLAQAERARDPSLPRWRSPRACIDLVALVLGHVYEHDRDAHVWHLDEVVRSELGPALDRLGVAIAAQLAG